MKLTRAFVDEVRELVLSARATVARGVDLVQVHTNFEIGRRIVEQEQRGKDRATYGKEVIRVLAARLSAEFGNGFSKSNLEYMRRFYVLYQERSQIAQTASGRLPAHIAQGKRPQARAGDPSIAQASSGQSKAGSYVLIDLKLGRLAHQDLGQMQMYVNYFDRHIAAKDERATIGIVLCKKKNEALVEITLPRGANIHAREYQLYLPSKAVLRRKLTQWAEEARGG